MDSFIAQNGTSHSPDLKPEDQSTKDKTLTNDFHLPASTNQTNTTNNEKQHKNKKKKKSIEIKIEENEVNAELLTNFKTIDQKKSMEISNTTPENESPLITPPIEDKINQSQDTDFKNDMPNVNNLNENAAQKNYRELFFKMEEFYIGERVFGRYTLRKEYLENRDNNAKIYHMVLRAGSPTVASFLIVHGACEHSSRYLDVARQLADNQFEVHLFDIRGFGRSSGARAMTSVRDMFEDLMLVMTKIQKNNPLFVLGHSMGGATMISFMKLNPQIKIAGLIVTNPFINFPERMKLRYLDRLIIKYLPHSFNTFMLNNEIDPHILTRSETTLNDIWADRFLMPVVTIKYVKTTIEYSDIVRNFKTKEKFNYPLFFIAGMKDRLTEMDSGCKFFDKLICDDKSFYYFEEGLHELLLDTEKEDVVNIMVEWIYNKLNNAEAFGKIIRLSFECKV